MSDVSSGDLKAELRTLSLNEWGIIGGFYQRRAFFERIMRVGGLDRKQGFPAEAYRREKPGVA